MDILILILEEHPKHYMLTNNNTLSNTVSEFAIDSNIKSNNKVYTKIGRRFILTSILMKFKI